jgi:small subunit ribosomal protein S20
MRRLLEEKDSAGAQAMLPQTFSLIDRAARWGIIKKNTAARYKARLTVRLRALASK